MPTVFAVAVPFPTKARGQNSGAYFPLCTLCVCWPFIGIGRICGNNLRHRLILVHTMAMSITFVSKYYCIFLLPFCGHCEGCTELRFRAVSSRICEAPTRKTNEVYLISCGSFKNPRNSLLGFLMGVFLKSPTMPHFRCHLCNTE
jgi:hypothetical protein